MPPFRQLKNYFHFNRGERRGLIVLFAILSGLILFHALAPQFIHPTPYDLTEFRKQAQKIIREQDSLKRAAKTIETQIKKQPKTHKQLTPFNFDPNELEKAGWLRMGLSEKQVGVVLNYRNAGGVFRKAADLAKIYSISSSEFEQLRPYIRIAESSISKDPGSTADENPIVSNEMEDTLISKTDPPAQTVAEPVKIELNSADTLELQLLPGIGPAFARRIVSYRQLLGGYFSVDQLQEVYGMDSLRYAGIKDQLQVDPEQVRTLNINTSTLKQLIRHPYIDYALARTILTERSKHGLFEDANDVEQRLQLPAPLNHRLKHYIRMKDQ